MIEQNESILLEDETDEKYEKYQKKELFSEGQFENKSVFMINSINCSSVSYNDSSHFGSISKVMNESKNNQLTKNYLKLKKRHINLLNEHNLLRSKCERQEQTKFRNSSSIKSSMSKIAMQTTRRKIVSLQKDCKMISSVHHPASIQDFEFKRNCNQNVHVSPCISIMQNELHIEAIKLKDTFDEIKKDIGFLNEFIQMILDDRELMISELSNLLNYFSQKISNVKQDIELYQYKIEELVEQNKKTYYAMNDYKRYSTELIEYYKSKSDNIQKSKRSKSNSNKYSNKSNSNINRSSGKISELDSTSGFKYIIAKTFIDFPETDNEVEIQKVLGEELQKLQSINESNSEQLLFVYKKKVEEYIRSIYSIRQMITNRPEQQSYLDNVIARQWMKQIKDKIINYKTCSGFLCEIYKAESNQTILENTFNQNIQQLCKQLQLNKYEMIQKIQQLSNKESSHLQFFINTTYSTFSKTVLTNFVNVHEFNVSEYDPTKWRKIVMNSITSLKRIMKQIIEQVCPNGNAFAEDIMRYEEEFIIRILKYVEYLNGIFREIKKLI